MPLHPLLCRNRGALALSGVFRLVCLSLVCVSCAGAAPEPVAPLSVEGEPSIGSESECTVAVLVGFHSREGHTEQMAKAVSRGAEGVPGVDVATQPVSGIEESQLLGADAIVLGSPVYNGNPSAEMLQFIEGWPFEGRPLENRVGAAFVSAGGISAGEEGAMHALHRPMLIYGMIVVGGDSWTSAFGASAVVDEAPFETGAEVQAAFLEKAERLGRRVATVTRALRCQ